MTGFRWRLSPKHVAGYNVGMNKITEPWLLSLFDFIETSSYADEGDLFMGVSTWDESTEAHVERHFTVQVNCNDLFFWGCSDSENIGSLDDVEKLKKAYGDVDAVLPEAAKDKGMRWYLSLYAARKREMRIQHGWYDKGSLPKELHALFNEAGTPREAGTGNPRFEESSAADLA